VRYKTKGKRQSGDVNTSLGNVLIMCSLVIAYAKEVGIVIRFVNDGDDVVAIMESEDEAKFRAALPPYFLESGLTMDMGATVYLIEQIVFCQAQPVFDGKQYVMIRDPRVSIAKDCISLKPLDNDKISRRFMASIGKGGLTMTGGIPVVQDFYDMLVRSSDGAKPLDDSSIYKYTNRGFGMKRCYSTPTAESRFSFYLAFGIPPDAQISIEAFYADYRVGCFGEVGPHYFTKPYL